MIKVACEVPVYEGDRDKECKVKVVNHWNNQRLVNLSVFVADQALEVSVSGDELKAAIDNAMNTKRF